MRPEFFYADIWKLIAENFFNKAHHFPHLNPNRKLRLVAIALLSSAAVAL
jgi:hypothetical protein